MPEHVLVDLYAKNTDNVTIVEAFLNASFGGEQFVVHKAKDARRNSADEPDETIGMLLAHGRALESLGKRLQREAWGRIKHKDDMKLQKQIDEVLDWAEMKVEKNLRERIQRAIIGVHNVGETKRWGINDFVGHYSGEAELMSTWRWFVQQDPAEVSRTIHNDGVIHGISKHRVKEIQKGVERVLDEHEALVRKTKADMRGEQA